MRERRAFQDEEWHVSLRHRAGDVSDDSGADCRGVRVLHLSCEEAIAEGGWNHQAGPLDVREHERLHAVLFGSDRELVERRDGRQRRRSPSITSQATRKSCCL